LDEDAVEVLVAEGIVEVASSSVDGVSPELNETPRLEAHERAIISLSSHSGVPQVAVLSKAEIQRVLSWQHGAMTFAAKPLAEIIDELNRLNDTQLTIVDPDLASERFTGTFLSSNVEGFVSVLKNGYGVDARMSGGSEILLSKAVD
jgi:transmembrane sensor